MEEKKLVGTTEPTTVNFWNLFRYASRKERFLLVMGGIAIVVAGASFILNFRLVVNLLGDVRSVSERTVEFSVARQTLLENMLKVILVGVSVSASMYAGLSSFMFAAERIAYRVRKVYFKSVLDMDMAWFDSVGAGEITTRLASDINCVRDGVGEKLALLIADSAIILAFIGGSFLFSAKLAACVCSLIILSLVGLVVGNVYGQRLARRALGEYAAAGSLAAEIISNIRTVQSFNMTPKLSFMYQASVMAAEKFLKRRVYVDSAAVGLLIFSVYMGAAINWKVGLSMLSDSGEIGNAMVFIFLGLFATLYSVASIPPNILAITTACAAAAKVYQIIDLGPSMLAGDKELGSVRGEIGFSNIDFHFPSRPDVPILKNFSLEVKAGSTVALVGPSGAGKSTLVQLMERFYDPVQGQVTLDGIDIREFDVKWLRRQIGLVAQEPVLFSGTVFENVALGLIGTPYEHAAYSEQAIVVEQACKDSYAHDFIVQLPDGYQTRVGEQGSLLSGGQKQRIAIARAIVKDPKILLLDEATSALDTRSEVAVQKALDRASRGRTTLVIAHRLSTIQNADMIVVMDRGTIVEKGTHQELLLLNGKYSSFASIQSSRQEEPAASLPALNPAVTTEDFKEDPAPIEPVYFEETGKSSPPFLKNVWSLMKLNLPELKYNVIGTLGAVFLGGVTVIVVLSLGTSLRETITNLAQRNSSAGVPWEEFLSLSGIAGLAGISQACCILGLGIAAELLSTRLRVILLEAMARQEVGWFDLESNSVGVLVSTTSLIPQRITGFTGSMMGPLVSVGVSLVLSTVVGLVWNVTMTLVMLLSLPAMFGLSISSLVLTGRYSKRSKQALNESVQLASESITQIRTVASLTSESQILSKYQQSQRAALKVGYLNAYITTICISLSASIVPIVIAVAMFLAALFLSQVSPTERQDFYLGAVKVIFLFVIAASDAAKKLSLLVGAKAAKDSAKQFNLLRLREPRINQLVDGPGRHVAASQGEIAFRSVYFSYPTRPNVPCLRGISFVAKPGKLTALVGASGCGKSTTIGLVERFYDATRGSIALDGVDIRDLHLPSLRDQISLVGQEPALFNLSIKENILLGARTYGPAPDMEKVIAAAKSSNIHNFIMSLPNGYETKVGGKGTQLSGGQKQRIAIARALIRNPQILLLDEATSALDAESEKSVQAALDMASQGRTTITIAHRLSTIRRADQILVIQDGSIVERGSHSELMALDGIYAEMARQQSLT